MSIYHISLLIAALAVAAISWRLNRALLWIGAMAASFIVSVSYLYLAPQGYVGSGIDTWLPPASVIAGLCDAAVATSIYVLGKRRWEIALYTLVVASVLVNATYAAGEMMRWPPIPPREVYAIILEAINYAALLLIGGTAIIQWIGKHDVRRNLFGRLVGLARLAGNALQKEARPSKAFR